MGPHWPPGRRAAWSPLGHQRSPNGRFMSCGSTRLKADPPNVRNGVVCGPIAESLGFEKWDRTCENVLQKSPPVARGVRAVPACVVDCSALRNMEGPVVLRRCNGRRSPFAVLTLASDVANPVSLDRVGRRRTQAPRQADFVGRLQRVDVGREPRAGKRTQRTPDRGGLRTRSTLSGLCGLSSPAAKEHPVIISPDSPYEDCKPDKLPTVLLRLRAMSVD